MLDRTTAQVLANTRQMLATVAMGLADVRGPDPSRRRSGLMNVIAFGRAVTHVLQTLRATEPTFDEWYLPRQQEMRADPLLAFFLRSRNELLKEGTLPTSSTTVTTEVLNIDRLMASVESARPPGATTFFLGDKLGGAGWLVSLPDGTTQSYYVHVPPELGVQITLDLPEAPETHLGRPLPDRSAGTVAGLYYAYLERLVAEAVARFGP